jgi:hypothetical protein
MTPSGSKTKATTKENPNMATSQTKQIDLGITRYEFGEMDRPRRAVLEIQTGKHYNGGLASDASVYWVGNHSRQQLIGVGGFSGGDYSSRLKTSPRDVKATQKAIDRQHAEVFTDEVVAGLVAAARAHYAAVVHAGVDGFGNTYPAEVSKGGTGR